MIRRLAVFLAVALAVPNAFSQAPTGSITNEILDSHNALYDATLAPLQTVELDIPDAPSNLLITYDDPYTQDGKGKLAGADATQITASNGVDLTLSVPGTYQAKGTVKGNKGHTTLKLSSKASGTATFPHAGPHQFTASAKYAITIDTVAGTLSGTLQQKFSVIRLGSIGSTVTINDVIPPELGNGSWTLILNFGAPDGTKLQGTATVTLATGQVYPFNFTGTFVDATGQSKLTLTGVDAGAGSKLTVTLQNGFLDTIKGKVAGQVINFID